ncbi:MAG: Stp1/IreP family PP2C-type Ser/Thr phosphatase [Clostridia bacterium]|nr:Stp1/IreP family PP2C-type Ser/Thr phosphatase [Clostridia bacterium]
MNYTYKSHIGRRKNNEDACRIPKTGDRLPFVAVADGMGGHRGGAVASRLVINGLGEELAHRKNPDDCTGAVKRAIETVNMDVFRAAQDDPALNNMGSTLVMAVLFPDHYLAANVGDSRLYHFDGRAVTQISRDHSLVELLLAQGHITPEEALHHPNKNIITRSVGLELRVEPDFYERPWKTGDILLLCSDGLSGSVSPAEMASILSTPTLSLEEMGDQMVSLALENGATDNITLVLAQKGGDRV